MLTIRIGYVEFCKMVEFYRKEKEGSHFIIYKVNNMTCTERQKEISHQ